MVEIGILYIKILSNFSLSQTHGKLLLSLHSESGSCEELVSTFSVLLNNWQAKLPGDFLDCQLIGVYQKTFKDIYRVHIKHKTQFEYRYKSRLVCFIFAVGFFSFIFYFLLCFYYTCVVTFSEVKHSPL